MSKDKNSKILNWDDFQSLGNPENAPDLDTEDRGKETANLKDVVRVYLERKGRGGKTVSIVKGLSMRGEELKELCKKLKSKCGVGGSVENDEIIIQGDQRTRLINELRILGYSNVKNAGA
jgi:translation initiation factor 1